MNLETSVCIIGAGLSRLALATALRAEGRNLQLLETRDRVSGRVLSQDGYELGPSWIWPHNRRLFELLDRLSNVQLAEMVDDKEVNIRNKLSRGTSNAAFLLHCLTAIGVHDLRN